MFKKHFFYYSIVVLFSLLIMTSCAGRGDYDIDLPGDYSVIRSSAHQIFISPKNGSNG